MMPGDRSHAAALLRRARRASGDEAAEAVSWVRCTIPRSRAALLLDIEIAIRNGDSHHADALLAQGLLLRPSDPTLLMHHAVRLKQRGLVLHALPVIERAAALRPHHRRTRLTAGELAAEAGEVAIAVRHYDHAVTLSRTAADADDVLRRLIDVHLNAGQIDAAEEALRQMRQPSCRLRSALLRARGRVQEAIALIEINLDRLCQDDLDGALCQLFDLCEEARDAQRISGHAARLTAATPLARQRAAAVFLEEGGLQRALAFARAEANETLACSGVRAIEVVASTLVEEPLDTLDEERMIGASAQEFSDAWRRGLFGCLVNELTGPALYAESPLSNLLRSARDTFSAAAAEDPSAARLQLQCEETLLSLAASA